MFDSSLFDPHSSLRFLIIRYIHTCDGVCFGQVVRSFFFHSGEALPSIDCFFTRPEHAEQFLAILAVEHSVDLAEKRKFGTNSFRVQRHVGNGPSCSVEVNIASFYQGVTSRGRLPRNIPSPMFDLDHVFWEQDAVLNTVPKCFGSRQAGRSDRLTLCHVLERCMQRKFCVVNKLSKRRPDALLITLDAARAMVTKGFRMDDDCGACVPVVFLNDEPNGEVPLDVMAIRLPCRHIMSFEDGKQLIAQGTNSDKVCCPACNTPFCVRDPTVEGII